MNLLTESLWGDEAFSALAVQKNFWEMIGVVMKDTAPPLFYMVGFVWTRIFGGGEVALRSLSLLLILGSSIFASLIIYRIEKRWRLTVLVGLLAFFSPFLNRFAFEWRMYALLAFTTSASNYFFVSRKWRMYVVATVAALYTHHFALFTFVGQGVWFLIAEFSWKKWRNFFVQLAPFWWVTGLYSLWLYPMYLQTVRVRGAGFWLSEPTASEAVNLVYRFLVGGVDQEKTRLLLLILVILLLAFKGWKKVTKKWLEVAFIFVVSPLSLAYGASYLITPVFYDRYLLSVLVGVAILLGMGIKKQLIPVLVVLVSVYGVLTWRQFINPNKRPFAEFADLVKSQLQDGDFLLNINGRAHHIWESKYYGIPAPIYTPDGPLPLYVGTAQMTEEDTIETIPAIEGRLATIMSEKPETIEIAGFKIQEATSVGELWLVWWEPL